MKGLILSGGKGTRLRPLTFTRAKQLIPVANKPVLMRVIETIRDAGITEIGIVVGDNGSEIAEAVGNGDRWGVNITYIPQEAPLGLAHAVKTAQPFIGEDSFVMFLGDNVIQGGISDLIRDFDSHDWNSQIVLKAVDDPTAFGVAKLRADGSIEQLIEKPKHPPSNLALVGIYMFDKRIFEAVNAIKPSGRGEYEITDAIQWLITQGYVVRPHIHQGWWIDTGKQKDMLEANCCVLDEILPTIAPDALIENSEIDRRVTVERGARIKNSVIHGPTIIGEDVVIEDAYVGPYTSIYHHVTLQGCEIERSIVLEYSSIRHLNVRLHGCLIGRDVKVTRNDEKPRALTLNLGDHSSVSIV
ncbi:MAG: glucose-1-phosphate thymidylyltransferase [Chloroflexota bacterium]